MALYRPSFLLGGVSPVLETFLFSSGDLAFFPGTLFPPSAFAEMILRTALVLFLSSPTESAYLHFFGLGSLCKEMLIALFGSSQNVCGPS